MDSIAIDSREKKGGTPALGKTKPELKELLNEQS